MNQEAQETVAKYATYGGAATASVFGGFSVNEWAAIFGVLIALVGLILQTYFKWREDERRAKYWSLRKEDDNVFLRDND